MLKKRTYLLLLALASSSLALNAWHHGGRVLPGEPRVGDAVDSLNGVVVYYNGPVSNVSGRNLGPGNYNFGLKYQCVEFVKRYYFQHLKHKMPDTWGHAYQFFQKSLADGALNKQRNLLQYANPSRWKPQENDLLVFDGNTWNPYGHVAIVSRVKETEIEIIQQNPGPTAASRIYIPLVKTGERWKLDYPGILGWLRKQ